MYGLAAIGLCLMLGLFTPLAALGGARLPAEHLPEHAPLAGLPAGPIAEGHYFIVNKNLIEMLACLVLACTARPASGSASTPCCSAGSAAPGAAARARGRRPTGRGRRPQPPSRSRRKSQSR